MSRKHPDNVKPYRQPLRVADGVARCRWCWGPVPKGRRTLCGRECAEEFTVEVMWNVMVDRVRIRDRGVCALCGCDTEKLNRCLWWARTWSWRLEMHGWSYDASISVQCFGTRRGSRKFYEVDHIKPRADGGTNELDNLRTLCVGCHAVVTRDFAGVRAERKRARKASLFAESAL